MTDFALCSDRECPVRENCLRWTAKTGYTLQWRSFYTWKVHATFERTDDGCEGFLPSKSVERRLEAQADEPEGLTGESK